VALPLDVSDSRSFNGFATQVSEVLAQHWQRPAFDYLVNNAGVGVHASLMETTEAQFDTLMNVHLKGVFFLTQALLPLMADGAHREYIDRTDPIRAARVCRLRGHEGCRRGVEPLHGQGTGAAWHSRERGRTRRH
jgi:NAD(P)-dependent dehydrogenase (short-subunit alcohol dehydrogenase family)